MRCDPITRAALLALALSGIISTPAIGSGKDKAAMDNNTDGTTRTLCLGRYLVDLPANAAVKAASFDYREDHVSVERASRQSYEHGIEERERNLRSGKHKFDPSLLKMIERSNDGSRVILAYWEDFYVSRILRTDGFEWRNGQLLRVKGEVSASRLHLGLTMVRQTLSEFRPRADDEIPSDPGFCIEGGFFAGEPEGNQEKASYRLRLKDRPDVWFRIYTDTVGRSEKQDGGLLARVKKPFPLPPTPEYLEFEKRVRKLREGKHPVGGRDGEELLEAYPNNRGSFGHHFAWEAQGKRGATLEPTIRVDFYTGMNSEGDEHNRPASLSDADATDLFDAIVNSIRPRPVGPARSGEAAPPPRAPLGELARSGIACPQTGWWACVDEGDIEGGGRRFLHAGETMPPAVLLGEPSVWQKLKGERPRHAVRTVWKLVGYGDAPGAEVKAQPHGSAAAPGGADKDVPDGGAPH